MSSCFGMEKPTFSLARGIRRRWLADAIGESYADQILAEVSHRRNIYPHEYEIQRLDVLIDLARSYHLSGPELLKIAKGGLESIALQDMQGTLRLRKEEMPWP